MLSSTMKENRYEKVMLPLVSDLKDLVETGIVFRGRQHAVRLANLQADGLERNAQFGLCQSFARTSYSDPLTYLSCDTRIHCKDVAELIEAAKKVRTKDTYYEDLNNLGFLELEKTRLSKAIKKARLDHDPEEVVRLQQERGKLKTKFYYSRCMKYDSPFNALKDFHVTTPGALMNCMSHDLLSGCLRGDVARVLVTLCNKGFYTWKDLQRQFKLKTSQLKSDDKTNWYEILCEKNQFKQMPGQHAGNHAWVRFLPSFFVGKDPDDPMFRTTDWAMLLNMNRLMQLVSAKVLSDTNLEELVDVIYDYLKNKLKFKFEQAENAWLNDPLTPKHVWILNYLRLILCCGPLILMETNLAESKNGDMRDFSTKSNQTKNVPKTVTTRELVQHELHAWANRTPESPIEQEISWKRLDENEKTKITAAGFLSEDVVVVKSTKKYGHVFKSANRQVIVYLKNGKRCFGEILFLIRNKRSKKFTFLVQKLDAKIIPHIGVYACTQTEDTARVNFEDFLSSKPLNIYETTKHDETELEYFVPHESFPF